MVSLQLPYISYVIQVAYWKKQQQNTMCKYTYGKKVNSSLYVIQIKTCIRYSAYVAQSVN